MIRISVFLSLFLLTISVYSQESFTLNGAWKKDNYKAISESQRDYLYRIYTLKVGGANELINGKEYVSYYNRSKLKPLLFIDKKYTASVTLGERKYTGVTLEYDTYLDELIYLDKSRVINNMFYQIALNKDPIAGFSLNTEQDSLIFRNFRSTGEMKFNLKEGFYEVAYDGISKYIIRHQSIVYEKDAIDEYFYTPVNYVKVGDNYSKIKSTAGLVKLFGDKSDEMRKYIRGNRINIRKADKKQIAKVLKYYDSLIKTES